MILDLNAGYLLPPTGAHRLLDIEVAPLTGLDANNNPVTDYDKAVTFDRPAAATPLCWGVYWHLENSGAHWIGDVDSETDALRLAHQLARRFNVPVQRRS
jgi:hypothetical protein